MKTALVAGATGLIGNQLISLLIEDERYDTIKCVTRKQIDSSSNKIVNIIADGNTLNEHKDLLKADDIFCCLGTTMKTAGSKEAFRKVDFDYPLQLAKLGKSLGAKQYHLVSAMGANPTSSVFYNQVKGEVENAIEKIEFDTFHIFRPSLLLGPREEQRTGEKIAKVMMSFFNWLIPKKYKAIESVKVARAMQHYASKEMVGKYVHESQDLQ